MDVMQAIKERRSVRRYRADPVSDEALNAVLEAAQWAPSWTNTQCWRFVVVLEPEMKQRLAAALKPLPSGGPNPAAGAIAGAPVIIVSCAQLGRSGYYRGERSTARDDWYMFDVGLAMQNLTLAAHALGLGTVHVGLFDDRAVAEVLDVPEGIAVVSMTPLGHPDETPKTPPRKELSDIVFRERYGSK